MGWFICFQDCPWVLWSCISAYWYDQDSTEGENRWVRGDRTTHLRCWAHGTECQNFLQGKRCWTHATECQNFLQGKRCWTHATECQNFLQGKRCWTHGTECQSFLQGMYLSPLIWLRFNGRWRQMSTRRTTHFWCWTHGTECQKFLQGKRCWTHATECQNFLQGKRCWTHGTECQSFLQGMYLSPLIWLRFNGRWRQTSTRRTTHFWCWTHGTECQKFLQGKRCWTHATECQNFLQGKRCWTHATECQNFLQGKRCWTHGTECQKFLQGMGKFKKKLLHVVKSADLIKFGSKAVRMWGASSQNQQFGMCTRQRLRSDCVEYLLSAWRYIVPLYTHISSVVPRSRFLGDTGVPLPEFQGDIFKFWGTHQIFQIFTC